MPEVTGNGDAVAAVIVEETTRVISANNYLVRGFIALGVSFVATGFAAKFFAEANRAGIMEAGVAVLEAGKSVSNK